MFMTNMVMSWLLKLFLDETKDWREKIFKVLFVQIVVNHLADSLVFEGDFCTFFAIGLPNSLKQ